MIESSPAAIGGMKNDEQIISINEKEVNSWRDINSELVRYIGEEVELIIQTKPFHGNLDNNVYVDLHEYQINIKDWNNTKDLDPLENLGIMPWFPDTPAVIDTVLENGAASKVGFQTGDRILSINGDPIANWHNWVEQVRNSPGKPLLVTVKRGNEQIDLTLTPEPITNKEGVTTGFAGVSAQPLDWPEYIMTDNSQNPLQALTSGVTSTYDFTLMTFDAIRKMLTGLISFEHISGPITIAKVANTSLASGFYSFLYFLSMISISLAVVNLLPIPTLDGGHFLYFCIEFIYGRPLPEKVQLYGLKLGMLIILTLMSIAFYNDIVKL